MSPLSRREALATGASALGVVAGCLGSNRPLPKRPTGEWRHRAHDAQNTGAADVTVPERATPAWDSGEAHIATPLAADGTIYTVANGVTALDAKNGDVAWEVNFNGKADYTPALLDDILVVAVGGRVLALDRFDGEEIWSTSLSGVVTDAVTATTSPPLVTVPVEDEFLQALHPETGDRLWQDEIRAANQATIVGETVYVTGYRQDGETGNLRAILASEGTRQWDVDLEHPDTPPVVAEETLLVADSGTLAVHDLADGERRRELGVFGNTMDVPPAVADGTAYIADWNGGLAAVSIADGTTEWRNNVQVTADTGVTVGKEAVVAPVTDLPGIIVFERSDGSRRWEHTIEGFDAAASTPAVLADGAVFYASNESVGVVALGDLSSETK